MSRDLHGICAVGTVSCMDSLHVLAGDFQQGDGSRFSPQHRLIQLEARRAELRLPRRRSSPACARRLQPAPRGPAGGPWVLDSPGRPRHH